MQMDNMQTLHIKASASLLWGKIVLSLFEAYFSLETQNHDTIN